jgi:hypothetical protein
VSRKPQQVKIHAKTRRERWAMAWQILTRGFCVIRMRIR